VLLCRIIQHVRATEYGATLSRITQHVKEQNWRAVGKRHRSLGVTVGAILFCAGCITTDNNKSIDASYIDSSIPLRIVSANDGAALHWSWGGTRHLPDSVTVIDLSPDVPPVTRTVAGAAPNSFAGAPYGAVILDGRYAFISNHPFGAGNGTSDERSQITVVDLNTDTLSTVETIELPHHAWQVMAHPDDARVIGISDHQFHLFEMEFGRPQLISQSDPFSLYFTSFAISPDGTSIIATAAERLDYSTPVELHLFKLSGDLIRHVTEIGIDPGIGKIDQPFAPRFSPDGTRALVLNGLGIAAKPPFDAVLSVDMTATPPAVTEMIPNVGQGLESLAFHPSCRFAVVTCIDGPYIGHLAVIDLAAPSMQLLYYLPVEFVPQGIEFSPDGSMLFVQSTTANHINVYTVDGFQLHKSPYVLRTGEGPASMAVSVRGQN